MLFFVNEVLLNKAKGSLLGLAIGDALGATNEFKTRESIQEIVRDLVGGGWLNLKAGEITDDTEMTLCILEAYASGYTLELVAENFLAWLNAKPKDIGNLTRTALTELKRGVSPRESGRIAWEILRMSGVGNGAVMRSAPTAILRASDREVRIIETIEIARITHFDQRAIEAALWLNAMIAAYLTGATDQEAWLLAQEEVVLARVEQHWDLPEDDVLVWVERARELEITQLDTSGYALATVQVAAWILMHSENFEDGLILAINQGGDADTIGAVTGALLGAKFGLSNIPKHWRDGLLIHAKLERTLEKALSLID
jgi:ADP-ribosyl-[dinitrogen reductase] hydrolase